ncbi:hypothetical protein HDR61_04680 [bacterium]|nr:hypothetical protein [bacterium]
MDMDRLEKLHHLMKTGAITKKEFETEKNKIMKPAARSGAAGGTTPMDRLEKLHELMQQGVISKEEFEEQKAKLISKKAYIESPLISDKKTDNSQYENCFDKFGKNHKEKYDGTRSLPAYTMILNGLAILIVLLIPEDSIEELFGFMWFVSICVFAGMFLMDYNCLKKLIPTRISNLTTKLIISCFLLLIPVLGFIPGTHFWIYSREHELMPDYEKYQSAHKERTVGGAIIPWLWYLSVVCGSVFMLSYFIGAFTE